MLRGVAWCWIMVEMTIVMVAIGLEGDEERREGWRGMDRMMMIMMVMIILVLINKY
ncbi:hypothetical protein BZA77DRAFT_316244 [Pyronema omphalodes]|nr:hypothetical protein BZA77DRAFT_316244 [Pyronema omphalodes]